MLARVTAFVCVLAFIFVGSAHAVKYKGWSPPDRWCQENAYGVYRWNCIKAQRVVYATFPRATRQHAMEVVSCETGRTFNRFAINYSTYVMGLFQVDDGWRGQVVRNYTIRHDLFNSWNNARAAFVLSNRGYDWGQWASVCRPY